jgi:hypothetical protein
MRYILAFLLVSCAHLKKPAPTPESARELPEWAYAPQGACEEGREICTSGEGLSAKEADAHALSALAAVFETKVSSEFSHFQSSQGLSSTLGQVKESSALNLKSEVDQYLQAVQFKERFKKKGLHYVLASLDKDKVATLIMSSLEKLDEELSALWQKKNRVSYRKMIKLLWEREALADRLTIVDRAKRSAPVHLKDIANWHQNILKEKKMGLKGQMPDWVKDQLKSMLSEVKIVPGIDGDESIEVKWDTKQEFLKVSGFSKWSQRLTISYVNSAVGNRGTLDIQEVASGRSAEDAELKMKKNLITELENNLFRLNIE